MTFMRPVGKVPGFAILCVLIMTWLAAAAQAADEPLILPVDGERLTVETSAGQAAFSIEIADDERERSAGLMFREEMADDHGMLFVFQQTRGVSFWMRNTPMPLDLIFITEKGEVLDILPGEPFSDAAISPSGPVRFVLEVKRGIAAKNDISAGDVVRHPAIDGISGR